ncbi:hypothetical protein N9195_02625 [bacterium]|nr:hypothetical protein [bacterium]
MKLRYSIQLAIAVSTAAVFSLPCGSIQGQTKWLPLPKASLQRIAFGSCAKHWQPQPIWDAVIGKKPDLFVFLGVNIYGDTDGRTAWLVSKGQMAGEWNSLADKPEFQRARFAMPFMATWDNHDYGSHAEGGELPVKEDVKEVFLNFFEEPEDSPRWKRSGFMMPKYLVRQENECRSFRSIQSSFKKDPTPKDERTKLGKVGGYLPDLDSGKTHLGKEQWSWLKSELESLPSLDCFAQARR